MQKLNIYILICLLLSYTFLAGCAKKDDGSGPVTVWHWMTDKDEVLQKLAKEYQEKTGVEINIDLYAPSDVYSQKITAAAQAKVLPDIFGILDTKEVLASYIKNGFIADLTSYFSVDNSAWEKIFFAKAINSNRFAKGNSYGVKPGIYGVPLDVTNIQMLYNKKLLKKAGYDNPPQTFKEFLEVATALKRVGVPVFVSGWDESWLIYCFATDYAFNIMGKEKFIATIKGEVKYTDPDWIKVFDIFRQLRDHGVFIEGIVIKGNKSAEQDFALGRAAFAFNGSWCVNVYNGMNPDLDYAPMLPPAYTDAHPMRIWGGAGSSFMVNNTSKRKEKAIAFLKWLTEEKQQAYFSQATRNLPANKKAISSIPEVLSEFAKGADYTTHPSMWDVNEPGRVIEKFTKGIQAIIIGDKTPEEVAKEVQETKDKLLEREQRRKNR